MNTFVITTDTTADFPESYIKEHGLSLTSLSYTIEGETYTREHPLPVETFYEKMRQGSLPTTAQVNPAAAKELFIPYLSQGMDVLHIAFSSGLSGSYNSCRIAAEELQEEYPNQKVVVVDSLCASLGEGLLVHKALLLKDSGCGMEEIISWLNKNKLHIVHNFTVDDLNHLYRGGRVSRTAAFIGTMINIKPILHVDDEGHLIPLSKVRGRKKSLITLVDNMEQQMGTYRKENDTVFISHGDCLSDAQFLADLIKTKLGIESFLIHYVGPTIGAHSGPGTIALFYMGEHR